MRDASIHAAPAARAASMGSMVSMTSMATADRRPGLRRGEFRKDYLSRNRPVVIPGAASAWPGLGRWTPRAFRERFGHLKVELSGDFFEHLCGLSFRDFIDLVMNMEGRPAEAFRGQPPPPYLRHTFDARTHDDFDDHAFRALAGEWSRPAFMPRGPYFRPFDPIGRPPNLRRYPGFGVLVSPRGGYTRYHVDVENDSNLLTQAHGAKVGYLFPPGGGHPRRAPWGEDADPGEKVARVLSGQDPDYGDARPLRFELAPGDAVFIPHGWAHEVFTLSASISLTYNFMHFDELGPAWLAWWLKGRNLDGEPLRRILFA